MRGGKREGAGRKEGSRNKKSVELEELMQDKFPDYDPVCAMAEIANDKKVNISLRLAAHKEVAKYRRPQLKAIEVTGADGKDFVITGFDYILPQ
ncbi:MAG: hypothetical protein IID03_11735 [Candidatus Dadabacteria bacterium]|nr:hypothetical protein [Candidatus Dadabacteria bacterium]